MATKPILGYWDIRGLAEPIRMLLAYGEIAYEDKRYTDRDVWLAEKFTLGLDFPNLPYFFDGDVKLSQTLAILRYLARKLNLDGADCKEKVTISLVEQQIVDLNMAMGRIAYDPNCDKVKEDYLKALPDQLKLVSNFLGEKPFAAGANLSYVDFVMYEYLKKVSVLVPGSLDATANLAKFVGRIESLPKVAQYIASKTPKLFNGPIAKWNAEA
ncbi:hypothetical protein RDWZM_005734 [Blomia tropicalis]|uniref:glutathione transferase n=1 Tax=Blomia tropicalis TaxID=40697 RepID=A0A9Q0M6K7_BLOTA|nr:hypothetical protein RDWZM_005734 [Blomia tropicalis]